jgi:hypothetical protein
VHENGGIRTITMHPEITGRGYGIKVLERFVEHGVL